MPAAAAAAAAAAAFLAAPGFSVARCFFFVDPFSGRLDALSLLAGSLFELFFLILASAGAAG